MLVHKTIVVRVDSCQNLAAAKMHMLLSHLSGVQIGLQQVERDRRVFCTSILAAILCKVVGVPEIMPFGTTSLVVPKGI